MQTNCVIVLAAQEYVVFLYHVQNQLPTSVTANQMPLADTGVVRLAKILSTYFSQQQKEVAVIINPLCPYLDHQV